MHFCQDELNAILAMLPFLGTAWFALRGMWGKLTRKTPATDCNCDHPYRAAHHHETEPTVTWRERARAAYAKIRAQVKQAIFPVPACQLEGHRCEFRRFGECLYYTHLFKSDYVHRHDVLYWFEGTSGRSFSYGMMMPYRVRCRHCKRPFRIGDPLPKGAQLDHYKWGAFGRREKPDYLTETEWKSLEESGYFTT